MSRYCVDTNAYVHFQRGDPQIVQILESAESIVVPSIVVGELAAGFLGGSRARENFDRLDEFLGAPVVSEMAVDHQVAVIFAEIFHHLRTLGIPVPTNDMWIAAVSARAGATLLTYDAHFYAIQRIGTIVLRPTQR